MNRPVIRPGEPYALAPAEPAKPLRPVTAIRAHGAYLIYAGPFGAEWAADMSRVAGPWTLHAEAAADAATAARTIGEHLDCDASSAEETGYCQYHVP